MEELPNVIEHVGVADVEGLQFLKIVDYVPIVIQTFYPNTWKDNPSIWAMSLCLWKCVIFTQFRASTPSDSILLTFMLCCHWNYVVTPVLPFAPAI